MQAGSVCLVLFDFSAVEEGELSVKKGEHVVAERPPQDDWVMVHRKEDPSSKGFVPEGYLEVQVSQTTKPRRETEPPTATAATDPLSSFDFQSPSPQPAAAAPDFGSLFPSAAASSPPDDLFASAPLTFAAAPAGPASPSPDSDFFSGASSAPGPPAPAVGGFSFPAASAAMDLFSTAGSPGPGFGAGSQPAAAPLFPSGPFVPNIGSSPSPVSFMPPPTPFSAPQEPPARADGPDPAAALLDMAKAFSAPIEPSPVLPLPASFAKQELYFKRLMAERAEFLKQMDSQLATADAQLSEIREKNSQLMQKTKDLDQAVETERSAWRQRLEEHQRILRTRPVLTA